MVEGVGWRVGVRKYDGVVGIGKKRERWGSELVVEVVEDDVGEKGS